MLSSIPRNTLPTIPKVVGLAIEQSLHHFLTQSPCTFAIKSQRRSPVCFLAASLKVDLTVSLNIISSIPITELSTAHVRKSVS